MVYNMRHEDPGNVSYSNIGGLSEQIRELRESIELPLMNPELFQRVGIKPPKVKPSPQSPHSFWTLCFLESSERERTSSLTPCIQALHALSFSFPAYWD